MFRFAAQLTIHLRALQTPPEISGFRNEIKDLFAIAKYEEAMKRLIDFARNYCPEKEDEAVMISQDFYELLRDIQFNFIEIKDAKLAKKQITLRALSTLETAWQVGSTLLLQTTE